MHEFTEFLISSDIPFKENISLKRKTWIKRGGIVKFWITPISNDQLVNLVKFLNLIKRKYIVVGYTSNLYLKNDFNPEIVISTIKINKYKITSNLIICDCGVSVSKLAKQCVNNGIIGFEGLVGLPGTVAASVVNNSSCYDCSINSMLESVDFLDAENKISNIKACNLGFEERTSFLKKGKIKGIILSVNLNYTIVEDKIDLLKKAKEVAEHRKLYQEGMILNLGSVFPGYVVRNFVNNTNIILLKLLSIFHKMAGSDPIIQNKYSKFFLFTLRGYGSCVKYISEKSINCFVWRDENADVAFEIYRECIRKYSKSSDIEIEIIAN